MSSSVGIMIPNLAFLTNYLHQITSPNGLKQKLPSVGIQSSPKSWLIPKIERLVVDLPFWKIWVRQLGLWFPIYGKIKHVTNHNIIYIYMQTNSKITTIWISNYFWIDQKVLTMELQMALDICSTNQCPTLIRKGLITKSLWQYPWRNPNKCHFRMVD